ncbi:transporter substrate-binding domain-containing protein, partial [bacterium]|nr:transporter substrate-binding domain-containing protein [bacterium]
AFSDNGEYYGIVADYLKLFEKRLGVHFESIPTKTWSESITKAMNYEVDMISESPGSLISSKFLFSKPYLSSPIVLIIPTNVTRVKGGLAELKGKRVLLVKDYGYVQDILKAYPDFPFIFVNSVREGLKMVATGQADVLACTLALGGYMINELNLHNVHVGGTIPFSMELSLGVRNAWPEMVNLLNKAIQSVTKEERTQIMSKWGVGLDVEKISQIALTKEEKDFLNSHPAPFRVHNEMDWPPYNYNVGGTPQGYSIDFMNMVAEKIGLKLEFISGPTWDEFMQMAQKKEIDIILNIAKSKIREDYLEFTPSYLPLSLRIIHRDDDGPFYHLNELKTKKMAVVENFFLVDFFKENHPDIKLISYPNSVSCLLAVARGEADVFFSDFSVVNNLMSKHQITNLILSPPLDFEEFPSQELSIAVREDFKILVSIIKKAIADISPQTMAVLHKKWIASPKKELVVEKKQNNWWVITLIVVILLVMIAGVFLLPRFFSDEILTRLFGSAYFRILAFIVISFMSIIVGLLIWYTLNQNMKTTLANISEELEVVLQHTVERNDKWINEQLAVLTQLGEDTELTALIKRLMKVDLQSKSLKTSPFQNEIRNFFAVKGKKFGEFDFCIINLAYLNVSSSLDSNLGIENLIAKYDNDYLSQVFEGKSLLIASIQSDMSAQSDNTREKDPRFMFFVAPVKDLKGDVIAALMLRMDPFEQMSKNMYGSQVHSGIESYIINAQGLQITKSIFLARQQNIKQIDSQDLVLERIEVRDPGVNLMEGDQSDIPRSEQPFTKMAQDMFRLVLEMKVEESLQNYSNIKVDIQGYRDYRGVRVFGAWIWEKHFGFGTVTEFEIDEALENYYILRQNLLIIFAMTVLMSIMAAIVTIMLGERAERVMRDTQKKLEERVE